MVILKRHIIDRTAFYFTEDVRIVLNKYRFRKSTHFFLNQNCEMEYLPVMLNTSIERKKPSCMNPL